MADKYTRRADASGWLSVSLTRSGLRTALSEYTRVEMLRETGGRSFFRIADGYISVGEEASMTTANAAKYLVDAGRLEGPVEHLSSRADERQTPPLLDVTGLFAHHDDPRVSRAEPEDRLRIVLRDIATPAGRQRRGELFE